MLINLIILLSSQMLINLIILLSSILDHFPNVGLSNIEQIQSKHRCIFLIYTSEHLFYIWILLLQHIDDATIGTCRDEMKSRSSSILDHFPDIGRTQIEQIQSNHRCIFLSILQNTYSMYGYYFCNILTMLRQALVIVEMK